MTDPSILPPAVDKTSKTSCWKPIFHCVGVAGLVAGLIALAISGFLFQVLGYVLMLFTIPTLANPVLVIGGLIFVMLALGCLSYKLEDHHVALTTRTALRVVAKLAGAFLLVVLIGNASYGAGNQVPASETGQILADRVERERRVDTLLNKTACQAWLTLPSSNAYTIVSVNGWRPDDPASVDPCRNFFLNSVRFERR